MKRQVFTLLFCALAFGFASAQMTIKMASMPATQDGVINASDPWVEGDWVVPAKAAAASTTTAMSSKFQLKYDATNLYFAAVVNDESRFITFSGAPQNDCVEFFISMDTTAWPSGVYMSPGTKQLRLRAVADPGAPGGTIDCAQTAPPSGEFTCVDNGSDYVQEWTMPWAELSDGLDPAWDQKQFRFDIQVADATADGIRSQQMFWDNNSDFQWNNTTKFGIVTLETPLNEITNETADMTIDVATKPVVADGVINASDPWIETDWIVPAKASASSTTTAMSSKFQLKYDATNLYFAAIVNDASRFITFSGSPQNDCVEFFISMDTTAWPSGTYMVPGTKQLRLRAVADPGATGGAIDCAQNAPPSGEYVCVDNGDNYVQEWIMPWSELAEDMDPIWTQDQFRFDIQVADATADGARTQQMFWHNNSDFQWNNTTKFGIVALRTPLSLLPTAIEDVKSNLSAIYVDNNMQLQKVSGLVSVYDVSGKLMIKSYAKAGSINVASLKKGIYIVHANNSSSKISIR